MAKDNNNIISLKIFSQSDFTVGSGFSPDQLLRLSDSSPFLREHHHRSGIGGITPSPCPEEIVFC